MTSRQRRTARQRKRRERQDVPAAPPAQGLLVPTEEPNVCVVFSAADLPLELDFGQFQNFPLMTKEEGAHLGRLVEQASTTANLGLKVAEGALRARGLVQLHPETVNALATGARTLQQGGWNIGTLAGPGGRFANTVKWLPAGAGATAITVASTAGAAVALLALQAQLNRIERLVERALETANEILAEIRTDQHNEIVEIARTVHEAMVQAQVAGAVKEFIWDDIGGQRIPIDLGRLTADALRRLQQCRSDLKAIKNAKERQEWFEAYGAQMSTDVTTVATGFVSSCRYEAMRLARASRKYAGDEAEEAAIRIAHEQARDKLMSMRDTLEPLIAGLWKHLSLLAECPGARGWNFVGIEQARVNVAESADRLRAQMSDIYQGITGSTLTEPSKHEVLGDRFASIRWLLDSDEEAKMRAPIVGFSSRILIATTKRILVVKQGKFEKTGAIESEHPLETCFVNTKEHKAFTQVDVWTSPNRQIESPAYSLIWPRREDPEGKLHAAIESLRLARSEPIASKHPASP